MIEKINKKLKWTTSSKNKIAPRNLILHLPKNPSLRRTSLNLPSSSTILKTARFVLELCCSRFMTERVKLNDWLKKPPRLYNTKLWALSEKLSSVFSRKSIGNHNLLMNLRNDFNLQHTLFPTQRCNNHNLALAIINGSFPFRILILPITRRM